MRFHKSSVFHRFEADERDSVEMPKPDSRDHASGGIVLIAEREAKLEPADAQSQVLEVIKVSARALAGFAVLYLLFYFLHHRFPYLQPGDSLVSDFKHAQARHGNLFQSPRGSAAGNPAVGKMHVMAFGYSKTLAGFIPKLFDSELAAAGFPAVESYNFGLPGDSRFVDDLEAMAAHGTAPDLALLTFPWPAVPDKGPTFFHFINNDYEVVDQLFPFRHMVRDFFIMLTDAHGFAGLPGTYAESERAVRQVGLDRGYYFISRQSHFKNDELPPDFRLPTDTPDAIDPRPVTLGPIYSHLARVLAKNRIECIFIPKYYREGEFAPAAPIDSGTVKVIAHQPNVDLIGPDYWLYPNRLFSDQEHANREGAALYTRQVAALVTQWMRLHPNLP
jgi:hypothetical protein